MDNRDSILDDANKALVEGADAIGKLTAEVVRLRRANAKLLAYAECNGAVYDFARGDMTKWDMHDTLRRHGWDGEESSADFIAWLRREGVKATKGS